MRKAYATIVTIVAVVSLIGNFLLYMKYSSQRPLITVNNQVIRRKDLDDRLDYLYADGILRQMIYADLIMQAAQKANVVPTDADVEKALDQIKRTSPGIIANSQKLDPKLYYFRQELKANLALNNLRTAGIQVTDQEVDAFYQQHRKQFAVPQQSQAILVVAPDSIGAQTAQRLLANGVAPPVIAGTRGLRVIGVNAPISGQMPLRVSEQLLSLRPGSIRTIPLKSGFLVAKITSVSPQGIPSLDAIRPQVELALKLSKAPPQSKIMSDLIENSRIVADTGKYAGAIPPNPNEQVASAGQ